MRDDDARRPMECEECIEGCLFGRRVVGCETVIPERVETVHDRGKIVALQEPANCLVAGVQGLRRNVRVQSACMNNTSLMRMTVLCFATQRAKRPPGFQ